MTYIYEKLEVWQKAMQFAGNIMDTIAATNTDSAHADILRHVNARGAQIAGVIAAGKSYSAKDDFARHLYQSRGVLYETMTVLELLKQKQIISDDKFAELDASANQLTAMLTNLVKSIYKPQNDKTRN